MCLRPRLPQLPVRSKPPNTPPHTEENLQKKNRKIAGFCAQSFGKTQLSSSKASFLSLCYCKCAPIQACCENITLPSPCRAFDFCLAIQRWHWFRFYSCRKTDVSLALWRDLPTHAIHRHFVANPVRRDKVPDQPFVFGTRIGNPSHRSEIFSLRLALWTANCSTGVKWCLAPDCCCSHCHVCRLLGCIQHHPSSKRRWRRGKQPQRRFMILLGQRKYCWEGVGPLSVMRDWAQTVSDRVFRSCFHV